MTGRGEGGWLCAGRPQLEQRSLTVGRRFSRREKLVAAAFSTEVVDLAVSHAGSRAVALDGHPADRVCGQFKDIVEMATDPVCGMAVERDVSVTGVRDGGTYYFCAKGCRDEFLGSREPEADRE